METSGRGAELETSELEILLQKYNQLTTIAEPNKSERSRRRRKRARAIEEEETFSD